MTTKPLSTLDSKSIFRYLYALVGIVLLLLVIASLFMLWRHEQVTQYHQKLSQYHLETTIDLDDLISEFKILETHFTQHINHPSDVHTEHPHNAIDISDHLFTIEK